ncbi:MAG: glycine/betaine ABC transporter [Chlamydiae bacterium SM23_39]|nr:MAG: glycine/betaine ABC transporter [Chlamydiae bacterium SM23_39]
METSPIIFILLKTWEHLQLTFYTMFISMAIAIPLGILLARIRFQKISSGVLRVVAIMQTIPGLALIALIMVFLVFLRPIIHLPTTGFLPGIIVLITYALLPILNNTYTGIKHVSQANKDIAKGMGMTSMQSLFMVEVPIALPVIITGVRTSLVWTIGLATLTSLVGSGGLGDLIMQGLRSLQLNLILQGTIPAALLAIILDWMVAKIGRWIEP